ncbi:MAG: hypothetical protein ACSLFD_01725 [Solirubrobacterales bacterium]
MADNTEQTPEPGTVSQAEIAERVLDNLAELEPELRAAAILGPGGESLASTRTGADWLGAANELLASVDAVRERPVDSAHLATETAEVFVVRQDGLSLIAVTGRFVLASLTSFDMRMALRDVSAGAGHA